MAAQTPFITFRLHPSTFILVADNAHFAFELDAKFFLYCALREPDQRLDVGGACLA